MTIRILVIVSYAFLRALQSLYFSLEYTQVPFVSLPAMASMTWANFKNMTDNILKNINTSSIHYYLSKVILDGSNYTMEYFGPAEDTSNSAASTFEIPYPQDVRQYLELLLPPEQLIIVPEFFEQPLFALRTMFKIAKLFSFNKIPEKYITGSTSSSDDVNDQRSAYLCSNGLPISLIWIPVSAFKLSRGSEIPIR